MEYKLTPWRKELGEIKWKSGVITMFQHGAKEIDCWTDKSSYSKPQPSHIKECFGFVPVREFGEFLRSDKIDYLAIAIIAGLFAGYFFYLLVKVVSHG